MRAGRGKRLERWRAVLRATRRELLEADGSAWMSLGEWPASRNRIRARIARELDRLRSR